MSQINVTPWGQPVNVTSEQRRIAEMLRQAQMNEEQSLAPLGDATGTTTSGPFTFAYRKGGMLEPLARGLRAMNANALRSEAEKKETDLSTRAATEAQSYFDMLSQKPDESAQDHAKRVYPLVMQGVSSQNPQINAVAKIYNDRFTQMMKPQRVGKDEILVAANAPGGPLETQVTNKAPPTVKQITPNMQDPATGRVGQLITFSDGTQKFTADYNATLSPEAQANLNYKLFEHGNPSRADLLRIAVSNAGLGQTAAQMTDAGVSGVPGGVRVPGYTPPTPSQVFGRPITPGSPLAGPIPGAGALPPGGMAPTPQPARANAPAAPVAAPAGLSGAPAPTAPAPAPAPDAAGGAWKPLPKPPAIAEKDWRAILTKRAEVAPQERSQVEVVSSTVNQMTSAIDRLLSSDLSRIADVNAKVFSMPGTVAATLNGELTALREAASVMGISQMRQAAGQSFGSMTQQEWPRFENIFGSLDNNTTVGEFKARLMTAKAELLKADNRLREGYVRAFGLVDPTALTWKPTEVPMVDRRNSPARGLPKQKPQPGAAPTRGAAPAARGPATPDQFTLISE